MTTGELLRARGAFFLQLLAVLLLCFCAVRVLQRALPKEERRWGLLRSGWVRLQVLLPLPVCFSLTLATALLFRPARAAMLLQTGAQYVLTYAVYGLLLLALLPLLRRRYSAACCACLWTLPNFSVFGFRLLLIGSNLSVPPLVTLRLGRPLLFTALAVWAAGFLTVLGWKICGHLRFRRRLLRDTVCLTQEETRLYREIRHAFTEEQPELGFLLAEEAPAAIRDASLAALQIDRTAAAAPRYERERASRQGKRLPDADAVLRSPAAAVPLAIGLFRRTARIVLPMREYTDGELRLIFRHELCHLLRVDQADKLFLTLQAALCWFLPSVWLGMERAAQDTELACDELVTEELPQEERRTYAALLLETAGNAQGFTTCLSASAAGLRYRLGRVLHPGKRRSGAVLTSLLLSLFLACFSTVGLAVEAGTVQTAVFDRFPDASLEAVRYGGSQPCEDREALCALLGGRRLYRDLSENDGALGALQAQLRLEGIDARLELYENGARVYIVRERGNSRRAEPEYYLFEEPFAWQSISHLFVSDGQ